MENLTDLKNLLNTYSEDSSYIIELQDVECNPVGAIYLSTINKLNTSQDIIISETNNTEKYFLYYNGIGIYFSYFKKLKI